MMKMLEHVLLFPFFFAEALPLMFKDLQDQLTEFIKFETITPTVKSFFLCCREGNLLIVKSASRCIFTLRLEPFLNVRA